MGIGDWGLGIGDWGLGAMADARLLANPASWGRVADPSPN